MSSGAEPMPEISSILWISVNPIVQLVLVGGVGYLLALNGILTSKGTKLMSQVYLKALVPSLMFSKMLDSVTPEAVERMAVVVPFVIFYLLLGLMGGFVCRRLFSSKLPPTLNYTLLVASGWSNWGDIPLAVLTNFTSGSPFKKSEADLAVAYVSVFMILFNVTLFPLGGYRFVEKDYIEKKVAITSGDIELESPTFPKPELIRPARKVDFRSILKFLSSLLTPVNISIVFGLVFGLTPAKDLFIKRSDNPFTVAGVTPPLYVIYDTARFLGAACVPVGLLNLGAALVDMELKSVPLSLSLSLALLKLIIMPLFGIPLVYWCSHGLGLIGKDERVLQLTLMFGSCVPSATTTLVLTQFYSPTGESRHLTSILIVQYVFGFFTMTASLAISSYLIFN